MKVKKIMQKNDGKGKESKKKKENRRNIKKYIRI